MAVAPAWHRQDRVAMATSVRDRCQAHPISKIYAAEAAGIGQTPGRPWTKSVNEQSRLYEL